MKKRVVGVIIRRKQQTKECKSHEDKYVSEGDGRRNVESDRRREDGVFMLLCVRELVWVTRAKVCVRRKERGSEGENKKVGKKGRGGKGKWLASQDEESR